jgi:hypothetical protein
MAQQNPADENRTDDTFDPEAETVTEEWEGAFIYTSWGYGQTNVELAQIVDVSDSGKTVLARLVKAEQAGISQGSESLRPSAEQYGDEFRLHVRCSGSDPVFRGSYPYINGEKETGTRKDSFLVFNNKAGSTVHQTAPNHGH